MGAFKSGAYINTCNDKSRRYIRISAGPQRGRYIHDIILEAKIGRKLLPHETAEHIDGNGLNNDPSNITGPITREVNSARMQVRKRNAQK